jgi:5-methylcytosine-specific restriction endonuclease McrA
VTDTGQRGAIGFAEKVLELLEEGRYTATYKYAVLLALIDVCLERTEHSGAPPDMVTTRQLADKIVEIYWPHTLPFAGRPATAVLRQNTTGQAEIVSAIMNFRARHPSDPSAPRWHSRIANPSAYEALVSRVEWKLIEMPLPRLQTMGQSQSRFIYEIGWAQGVERRQVARYQAGAASEFDNRVLFKPGVGEYLLQLSGLLRPLIQRRWAAMVAHLNRLEESQLDVFLFGADRTQTARIRAGLWEIQERRCFYCHDRVPEPAQGQVDHFVPWSRHQDDGLDNLVVADKRCNGFKSSSLAAAEHVVHWARRFNESSPEYARFTALAEQKAWDREPVRSLSVARAIYQRLPEDARLWLCGKQFIAPDPGTIGRALSR